MGRFLKMRNLYLIPFAVLILFSGIQLSAQPSGRENFDAGWKFHLGDLPEAEKSGFADGDWRTLDLPHDWSIEGNFKPDNPATNGGASLPGGIGWYRKTFSVSNLKRLKHFITFDGVYMNSKVWLNGYYLGNRPNGYATFQYELSPYLAEGENTMAVRVDNSLQPNSRWYSGSGIYRHVWMTTTSPVHVGQWGTTVSTPKISKKEASVQTSTSICNETNTLVKVKLVTSVIDNAGNEVVCQSQVAEVAGNSNFTFKTNLKVSNPQLWDIENPNLYQLVSKVIEEGQIKDSYMTTFGIRSIAFSADSGFYLNGKHTKILGVCMHHDLGSLGAAFNLRAAERQLEILKEMGCNAIRTSHNQPAPEVLDLCDKMGFLVMDEAFDCWTKGKSQYDFSIWFNEWHERELSDLVKRDRNHPSIILWSIGNEIPQESDSTIIPLAKKLTSIIKKLDNTRFVTCGLHELANDLGKNSIVPALDIIGINYSYSTYDSNKKLHPDMRFIASETTSQFSSRGVYHGPLDKTVGNWSDMQSSAYDNGGGRTHQNSWKMNRDRPFFAGMFVWTGFDYLGEPAPYPYPAVSSYFGIIDLCGFPKDIYYFYQSQWTKKNVLHILPHWSWTPKDTVDVVAYTNCDEVKLYLNDQFIGTRKMADNDNLSLSWKRIPFMPGTLRAEGFKNGVLVAKDEVKSAGDLSKIELTADRTTVNANGNDLTFITVKLKDSKGVLVPDAANLINFAVEGEGEIAGVGNGNPISLESNKGKQRRAFNGMCLVIVKSSNKKGTIVLKASSLGMADEKITIISH